MSGPSQPPFEVLGGRYRLVSALGAGAMASVYRARDEITGDQVAVKIADPRVLVDPVNQRRFAIEVRSLLRLEHPHVVRVFDSGSESGVEYYVMELCEGGSLGAWVETHGPMPPRLATGMIIAASEGLHAAHELGIVHRDVKPANLLLTTDGRLKLADFGIVRLDDDNATTISGFGIGTIGYVAPEQREDGHSADRRADVFSLAATLHTLLTSRIELDLFAWEIRPEVFDGVPEALVPVLKRAVAFEADERTPTAMRLADELRDAIPGLPRDPPHPPLVLPVSTRTLPAAPPPIPRRVRPAGGIPRSSLVLLVDEDASERRAFRVALESGGFKVIEARTPAEARTLAKDYPGFFDAAIVDVLAAADDLCADLRTLRPGIPLLYASALTTQSSLALGIDPTGTLIRKPCNPVELVEAVHRAAHPEPTSPGPG